MDCTEALLSLQTTSDRARTDDLTLVFGEVLIVTASDKKNFPRVRAAIGEPFLPEDVKAVRMVREVMLDM